MDNDKIFIAYASALTFGIGSVIMLVIGTSAGGFPGPLYLIEHVALGLSIRAFYKSFDGESGFYAIASGVREYFGIAREATEISDRTAAAM